LNEENNGTLLAIHVSGKLVKADYEQFVPALERLARQHGKLRLLFDMTDFHGWDISAAWEDCKFGVEHFAGIGRMAMVGGKKWQQGRRFFANPLRRLRSATSTTPTGLRRASGLKRNSAGQGSSVFVTR